MTTHIKKLHLRVMAEYASSGIWVIEPIGSFRHGMVSHATLNLPEQLAQRFNDWIERYYARLNIEDNLLDIKEFNAEGFRLATELKIFLGVAVYVEFVPEDEIQGVGQPQEIRLNKYPPR